MSEIQSTHGEFAMIRNVIPAVVLSLALATLSTDACSCVAPPPPLNALEKSVAVFLGKVVNIDEAPGSGVRIVTMDVERWWKGGDAAQIKVATESSGASCGFGFQKDERYLIYSHHRDKNDKAGLLQVSLCSRSRSAKTAEGTGDFKDLGEGKAPAKK